MQFIEHRTRRRLVWLVCAVLLALAAVPAWAQPQTDGAHVRFAHLAAGADPVDIYLDETCAIEALAFGQASDYLALPGGAATATIRPAGAAEGAELLSLPLDFPPGDAGYYTVALVNGGNALIAVTLPQDGVPAATGAATAGNLTISGAYVRATATGGTVTAAYLTIANGGATEDRLVSVDADIAMMVEMHETTIENDVARMRMLPDGVPVPAGGSAELKPGGMHLMLMGLTGSLAPGQVVTLTLTFESGAVAVVRAPVRMP